MNPTTIQKSLAFAFLVLSLVILPSCASSSDGTASAESCACGSDCPCGEECGCGDNCQCAEKMVETVVEEKPVLTAEEEIKEVMQAQVEAWNAGNIDGFMEGYWKSDDLIFTSGGRIRRGWQRTLDGYKKSYDTKEKMGKLTFSDLEVVETADNEAVVVGKWKLSEVEGDPSGGFTLVFRRFIDGWRIVRDHTSSD